jgi:hypothetical protein
MVGSICPQYGALSSWQKDSCRGKVWIDEELGPLRRLLDHPAWNVLVGIPFLILLIVLSIRRLDHHIVPWGFLILPSQTVMRLQQIVKPRVSSERLLVWQSLAPIHSEHWGEPHRARAMAFSLAMPSCTRHRCFVQPIETDDIFVTEV